MRRTIAFLTTLTLAFSATESQACCLTDWLFGRTATPYAVGYAPVPATAVASPTIAGQPYAAGYAPTTTFLPPTTASNPLVNNGVYQAQRAAYIDNPSVYTGMPVTGNVQTSYQAPVTTYRAPITTNTQVPAATYYRAPSVGSTAFNRSYMANYAAAQQPSFGSPSIAPGSIPGGPAQITTPTGTPATAIPATQVAPLYQTQPVVGGGLRRFFSALFGTGYRSSYYRAPITYYRPVTSVDPVTGTTVTVQQPCTSTVQQLQRTPVTTYQPSTTTIAPATGVNPPGACQTPGAYSGNPYSGGVAPQSYAQPGSNAYGAIGQAGAVGANGQTIPIPSTAPVPSSGYNVAPGYGNSAPLQGAPGLQTAPGTSGGASPADLDPVNQPRLESARPADNGQRAGSSPESSRDNGSESDNNGGSPRDSSTPDSYWQLQNADDSTAMIRRSRTQAAFPSRQSTTARRAEPIRAPQDYVSPFRAPSGSQSERANPAAQPPRNSERDAFEAPPLPARSTTDPSDLTSVSTRSLTPAREAALIRTERRQPVQRPIKRDSTWFPTRK